ncbi:MAG: arsenite efflux transporter metallochaperone ArsD [Bacillus sp. (in: Bacteria)]|nr:arsenite efflux transporter metallochaperone ArsD [Bacillus sp. (in: firmicutes)]
MKKIRIYDPALCCPTGVCGPSVDPELVRVASTVFLLEKKGMDIKRFNLASEPHAFVENTTVQQLLEEKGTDALPLVMVDGKVESVGSYPLNEKFAEWTGLDAAELEKKPKKGKNISLL